MVYLFIPILFLTIPIVYISVEYIVKPHKSIREGLADWIAESANDT